MFSHNAFSTLRKATQLLTVVSAIALSGCGSDNDEPKVVEPPITNPAPTVPVANQLKIEITGAQLNAENKLAVSFFASDKAGNGVTGVDNIRLNAVKLVPGANGNASKWVAFTKGVRTSKIDGNEYSKPDSEKSAKTDGLIDNNDGSYVYTFETDVANAADPVSDDAIAWEENLTHRVTIQVYAAEGRYDGVDTHFDWVPNGGVVTVTRDIVTTESCNQCHTDLNKHGGRNDVGYCVTCHTPDIDDPAKDPTQTADFKVMVHKIHRGINLPTIAAATVAETDANYRGYAVTTGGVATGVAFPQDIRNCTNCHVGEDDKQNNLEIAATATKDGDNWKQFPTIEACGSCHDDMAWNDDMLTVQGTRKHEALFPATNEDCSTCHVGNDLWYEVEKVHTGAHKASIAAAALITFETTSVKQATNGFDFTVKVSKDGQQIGDYAQIEQYLKREVYVMFNWDNGDGYEASYFNNHVTFDTCLASPDSDDFICHWDSSSLNDGQAITTGTGVFTFADALSCIDHNTNQLIDCDATDDNGDALEIALVPLPLSISHYDMSTLTTTENYENKFAADLASCKSCHSADMNIHATRHGASDFTQCTSCHNATRAAFYSGRPADLKYQVHKLHASNDPGGHGVIKFPAELNNCQQCHSEGQIDLPLAQNPRASKTNNPAATGDVFTSPTAVVCTTCHIAVTPGYINTAGQIVKDADGNFFKAADGSDIKLTDVEQNIINHMILAGGAAFGAPTAEAATGTEACATCHAIGSVVGVDKVHGLND